MKKLMFGLAIAAVGTAFAVESSNIVGYQQLSVPEATSAFAPTFLNVAEGTMPLQDVVPFRANEAEISDSDITVETIDENGEGDEMYEYLTTSGWDGEGWYPLGYPFEKCDKEFEFGEGIVLTSNYDDLSFTLSGQVNQDDTAVPIPEATSMFGNTRPVDLELADLVAARANDEEIADSEITLETIDENGEGDEMFEYLTTSGWEGEGWYPLGYPFEKADFALESGRGAVLTSNYDDAHFELPEL